MLKMLIPFRHLTSDVGKCACRFLSQEKNCFGNTDLEAISPCDMSGVPGEDEELCRVGGGGEVAQEEGLHMLYHHNTEKGTFLDEN